MRLQVARPASDRIPVPETARRRRSIQAVACVALLATLVYLAWRTATTMSGSTWWLSVPLLVLEVHALVSLALFTHDLWNVDVRPDAQRDVAQGNRTDVGSLSVAVLIPTYNEPRAVLLPTIAAGLATHGEHETWVLDDGNRPWVAELAAELGAHYRSRDHGAHAKAGNLNEALPDVRADVIAVVDADHVATAGFLDALLPYFADPRVALVQSPQEFYNTTSFEHVARRRGAMFAEQQTFYRAILAGRNRWGAAFWCGTGALVRVAALESVGGVATSSVTEDIQTSLRLHRKGWRTVHHNEVLAHGIAADDAAAFYVQRSRWGAGAMQVLRRDNPSAGPGLSAHQRISYLSTLLGWFDSWRTLGYILLPIATVATAGLPMVAGWRTFLVIFVPTFAVQRLALRVLSRGRAPLLHSTLFDFVRLPASFAATLALIGGGPTRFVVTPKGASTNRERVRPPMLLTGLATLSAGAVVWYLLTLAGLTPVTYDLPWVAHGAMLWVVVNTGFLVAARRRIMLQRYAGNRRDSWRFATGDVPVTLEVAGVHAAGSLSDLSLNGGRLHVPDGQGVSLAVGDTVLVEVDLIEPDGTVDRMALRATVRSVTVEASGALGAGLSLHLDTSEQARLALVLYLTVDASGADRRQEAARPAPGVPSPRRPA
ncbi:MAG TPA: glycosyltransferase [Cellulomonas sp.]|uniref:glycosyltransferase n=1 Tax=Cellulomonas sp. TaxID=40001 RepID=UPI002E34803A|nr:glycosyltransferase [Cellulomonas sp.]HEX5332142.1 glycosyltransferase [Cellulomonas sp.]